MSDTPDSTTVMILFPDFEVLKKEVEKIHTELSMLFLERDELLYHECKNIEMAYMLAVGALEYKAFELECTIRRQKRKIELIQAKKNRQEKIIISQIDKAIDEEFSEYQARLNEQIGKMNAALERSHGTLLTDEETHEIKKLYRTIVKAIHPDLNPNITNAQKQLFLNAVEAYERCDLNALRIICTMVAEPVIPDEKSDGMATLLKEKERMTKILQTIKESISKTKSEFPYTMKEFVNNPEEIETRKAELQEQIDQLNELLAAYKDKITEMLR